MDDAERSELLLGGCSRSYEYARGHGTLLHSQMGSASWRERVEEGTMLPGMLMSDCNHPATAPIAQQHPYLLRLHDRVAVV